MVRAARSKTMILSVVLLMMAFADLASARSIYRFLDEEGVVHLTDSRPPQGSSFEIIMRSRSRFAPKPDPEVSAAVIRELEAAAARYNVDPNLVKAIARVESNYNPKAVSPAGAMGVMQLIPSTAARYGVADAFDYTANIDGGVRYIRDLLEMFDGDMRHTLAAYNAGEMRVKSCGGIPNIPETRLYVSAVVELYEHYSGGKVAPSPPLAPQPQPEPQRPKVRRPIRQYVDPRGVITLTNRP